MLRRGFAAMLVALAGSMALVWAPARAQAIVVNGVACAAASVQFSSAGMVTILPPGCSGNGNPCESALVTIASTGISIQAPPACLTAGPVASPTALQAITVNGNACNGATVTVSAAAFAIDAPLACLGALPPAPLALLAVQSRKVHGIAGSFDLPIDPTQASGGSISVEPRSIGAGHAVVFQFDGAITSTGTVSAVDSSASTVSISAHSAANEISVILTDVPDRRRVTVFLNGVNGTTSASASIGFLVGDVNNSRTVSAADVGAVKAFAGQVTDATNFRYDLKASGRVNAADIAAVKARLGATLVP